VEHESGNTPQYRMKENEMATTSMSAIASAATSVVAAKSTPAQGALGSAGAGITGGASIFLLVVLANTI
jgi:hypothetical protein